MMYIIIIISAYPKNINRYLLLSLFHYDGFKPNVILTLPFSVRSVPSPDFILFA